MTFKYKINIFIKENACEMVVCEMAAIMSRSQCVKEQMANHRMKMAGEVKSP